MNYAGSDGTRILFTGLPEPGDGKSCYFCWIGGRLVPVTNNGALSFDFLATGSATGTILYFDSPNPDGGDVACFSATELLLELLGISA